MPNFLKPIAPPIGLFFLSPLIGEFPLGNLAIDALLSGLFAALLYGGGALLIREVTRRAKWGWITMLLLGLAYYVFEELAFLKYVLRRRMLPLVNIARQSHSKDVCRCSRLSLVFTYVGAQYS